MKEILSKRNYKKEKEYYAGLSNKVRNLPLKEAYLNPTHTNHKNFFYVYDTGLEKEIGLAVAIGPSLKKEINHFKGWQY